MNLADKIDLVALIASILALAISFFSCVITLKVAREQKKTSILQSLLELTEKIEQVKADVEYELSQRKRIPEPISGEVSKFLENMDNCITIHRELYGLIKKLPSISPDYLVHVERDLIETRHFLARCSATHRELLRAFDDLSPEMQGFLVLREMVANNRVNLDD